MKQRYIKLTALVAALTALALGACTSPLSSRQGAIPPGKGVVRVAAAVDGGTRTLLPSAAEGFSRYEYWFAKDGGTAEALTPVDGAFELDPGEYTVTVKAFAPGESPQSAAEGTSAAFTITEGTDAGAVTVTLTPVVSAGEGTLAFTLAYPRDATLESFTLTRLAGSSAIDLTQTEGALEQTSREERTFFGEKTGIGAGYYLVRLTLKRGLTYTGKTDVAHIYHGAVTTLDWAFTEDHFTGIPVTSSADSGPGTLREALTFALEREGGVIFIDLPEGDRVITLTSPLPRITFKTITIEGGGATLTQSGFTPVQLTDPAPDTNLLAITSTEAVVTLRRLHFTGGRVIGYGGAIYNEGDLTLESCIFSHNRQTLATATNPDAGDDGQSGGAVFSSGPLTVRGCTFYNNEGGPNGGAIRMIHSTVFLAGNLFFGNTSTRSIPGVSAYASTITSGGYNISANENTFALGGAGDQVDPTLPLFLSPVTFKPIKDSPAVAVLPDPLPEDYPAADFSGAPILPGGAAGAVQAPTQNTVYLDYAVNAAERGTVSDPAAPDADGLYAAGTTVTLTAADAGVPWVFSHWTVNGIRTEGATLTLSLDAHKTVRAFFARTVTDAGDTAGTAEAPTLRYALTNLLDDDVIILPPGTTITLGTPLPQITRNVTIDGNGATLTQSGFTPGNDSQLLYIGACTVIISRVHFTGGRATTYGAAIRSVGDLTLDSCIFSDNQTAGSNTRQGGAIHMTSVTGFTNRLTVRGCTFYNNAGGNGGVIYRAGGFINMTGNLFTGNTAYARQVLYTSATLTGSIVDYNVSDTATGTANAASGYANAAGVGLENVFSVTDIAFDTPTDPTTKPSSGTSLKTLTALPEGFPAVYFDGTPRTTPATAGAVSSD